jgi:type II secretory pathway component PulF
MSAKFTYTARGKDGKIITGTGEAANREALLESLRRQEVRPLVVKEVKGLNLSFSNLKN